jgi:hypothetical protein
MAAFIQSTGQLAGIISYTIFARLQATAKEYDGYGLQFFLRVNEKYYLLKALNNFPAFRLILSLIVHLLFFQKVFVFQ